VPAVLDVCGVGWVTDGRGPGQGPPGEECGMTTMATHSKGQVDAQRCGCCARIMPAERVTELGTTPGVYICGSCAVWAARRSTRLPVVRLDPRLPVQWLRRRMQARQDRENPVGMAIPILPSADLDRTAAYYQALGLKVTGRYDGYLVLNAGSGEMHLSSDGDVAAPGQAFVHVADARRLWKQLKDAGVAGSARWRTSRTGCGSLWRPTRTATGSAWAARSPRPEPTEVAPPDTRPAREGARTGQAARSTAA
jgi:hypothetical protein